MKTIATDGVSLRRHVNRSRALFSAAFIVFLVPTFVIPASAALLNGGFEAGLSNWISSGNLSPAASAPYVATEGTRMVVFNNGNRVPNGVLQQSFATIPGKTYTIRFDMGVLAYNNNEQRLMVEIVGGSTLATRIFSMSRIRNVPLRWRAQGLTFTADSAVTVLTFRDRSVTTASLDLLLDNIRVGPPIIEIQPTGMTVDRGTSATFQVSAWGGALTYQWRLNGAPIPGATQSHYTIAVAQASDAGLYDVVVTDSGDSVTSDAALLVVVGNTLINGGFEAGYTGWTVGGNQEIQSAAPYGASEGVNLVSFNSRNTVPNGVLSQTFATVPGMSYLVTFDMGFLAYNRESQRLRVVADGNFNLSDREFTIKSTKGEILRWVTQQVLFTADSSATTLSFMDRSATSLSLDLLLDHVRVLPDPLGFSLIPAGSFQMGDSLPFASNFELPVRTVNLDAFYMAKYEVTAELWNEVWSWAAGRGYTDLRKRVGKSANHPVQTVSWRDAVKWCNARSEMEGLVPCYRAAGNVYRAGYRIPQCDWSANGYRLPTEAEWEKAARGGLAGLRFPWGNTISHENANYVANTSAGDISPVKGYHPLYQVGEPPYTSPVGSFPANGYGLHDVSGNVFELCWDFWADSYDPAALVNPKGPDTGFVRIVRGGSWGDLYYCPNAARSTISPDNPHHTVGFRLARNSGF